MTISSGDSYTDVPGFGAVASRTAMMVGGAITEILLDAIITKGIANTSLSFSPILHRSSIKPALFETKMAHSR